MSYSKIPRTLTMTVAAITLIGAVLAATPMAQAAECEADVGPVHVNCRSDGPGGCAAAAYSGGGGSGAGCVAWDYPA